jgi:hypothetical protein
MIVSVLGIVALALYDPKRLRKRGHAPRHPLRIAGFVLALAPGLWLAVTGRGVAFLLWIGASAVMGWGSAAVFGRRS